MATTGKAKKPRPPAYRDRTTSAPSVSTANGDALRRADLPARLGLARTLGALVFVAALVLAPLIGGSPSGAAYGADAALYGIRLLVLAAGLTVFVAAPPAPNSGGAGGSVNGGAGATPRLSETAHPAPPELGAGGASLLTLWLVFALTFLSLLVRSRFFTSPVLLFAQLPAALDWLCYVLAAALAARLVRTETRAASVLAGALVLAGIIVAVSVARDYGENAAVLGKAWRAQGVFFAPNFAAGFLALCLPVGAALCLAVRERLSALVLGVGTALMAGALVATGSRAGVLAAGLGLGVAFGLALLGRVRLPWPRVGATLAAVALLAFAFRAPLLGRVGGAGTATAAAQEHSGDFRAWTWRGTLRMANEHPLLGAGPGTFEFVYPRYALVAKTSLAHSSYLQIAAEQGWPAFVAVVLSLVLVLAAGARCVLLGRADAAAEDAGLGTGTHRLILCALLGSVVAGATRSYFDSEWSLLGNALPFWTVAGLAAGLARTGLTPLPPSLETHFAGGKGEPGTAGQAEGVTPQENLEVTGTPFPVSEANGSGKGAGGLGRPSQAIRLAAASGLLAAFVLTLLLFNNAVRLTSLLSSPVPSPEAARAAAGAWPPDPNALAVYARLAAAPDEAARWLERAARVEPSGARFFRLGRVYEQQVRPGEARQAFERAAQADPTALQTWRALAQARANVGDRAGALDAWRRLVALHEGPVGQIRAIPEQTETHPAFAYAALADHAAQTNNAREADENYDKAASVVERYADTAPVYQMLELAAARQQRTDLAGRRRELRGLYARVLAERLRRLPPGDATERENLTARRDTTLGRLDTMIAEAGR